MVTITAPRTSTPSWVPVPGWDGMRAIPRTRAAIPMGRLMKKIQCQLRAYAKDGQIIFMAGATHQCCPREPHNPGLHPLRKEATMEVMRPAFAEQHHGRAVFMAPL